MKRHTPKPEALQEAQRILTQDKTLYQKGYDKATQYIAEEDENKRPQLIKYLLSLQDDVTKVLSYTQETPGIIYERAVDNAEYLSGMVDAAKAQMEVQQ